jgi:hypothetical protein
MRAAPPLQPLIYHATPGLKSGDLVFTHGFGKTTRLKSPDHSTSGIEEEFQRMNVPSRTVPLLHPSKNFRNIRTGRRWRPSPTRTLLATGLSAFLCVTVAILVQDIHPPPDKLTFEKDAAELESMEKHPRVDDSHSEKRSLPSAIEGNARIDRVEMQTIGGSQFEAPIPKLIASRGSLVDRKNNTDSGATRRQLRTFKRDLEGRPDSVRNPQKQRAVAPTRQRYEQRGLSSFMATLGRVFRFSSN